ncbi:MFS transporter [Methylacidiphilum caldifontis]|uniref:MFS transporter n=1 Tax=Methylacidiphilum caldifontis TaxID=2795386 RepID=UPI001A8DFA56|nr:MFS transporter [Methylacidiphilum caldifontis]QSR87829.1 MFS transporter [Methylacidiphilum caldifontis]
MNNSLKLFFLFFLYFILQCFCFFQSGSYTDIIPYATAELGQSQSHGAWTNGFFFLGQGFGLLMASPLSLHYGRKKTVLFFSFLLSASSILCAWAWDFYFFLIGRLLQGICCGVLIIGSQSLMFENTPETWRVFPLMLGAMASVLPFTIGPTIGGYGKEFLGRESSSWRYWFYLSAILFLILSLLLYQLFEEKGEVPTKKRWDWKGSILLFITLAAAQMIFNMGDDYEWLISPIIDFMLILAIASFIGLIVVEFNQIDPFLRVNLLLRKNFLIGSVCLTIGFLFFYGLWTTLLVRLQNQCLFPPHQAGTLFIGMALFSTPISFFLPRLVGKIKFRIYGFFVFVLLGGLYSWMGYFDFYQKRWFWVQSPFIFLLQGIALGLFFIPLTNLIISGLSPKNQLLAVELSSSMRIIGQGWASPIIGTILYHRIVFHKMRLADWLYMGNPYLMEYYSKFKEQGMDREIAFKFLDQSALSHAFIISLDDAFRFCGIGFFILSGLILLAKEKQD